MKKIHSSTNVSWLVKLKAIMVHYLQSSHTRLYEKITKLESRKWKEDDIPWSPLTKPLQECNVALVTTGGIILKEQEPFDLNDLFNGDCSYREIPKDADINQITISHMLYDHQHVEIDTEVIFPLNILKKTEEKGIIGRVNNRHYSFSSITNPTPLISDTAPEAARNLANDQVDLAILTPA